MGTIKRDRVLVLENDPFTLDLYARHLTRAGFEVVPAEALVNAYDALERELFTVCVVDLMMDDPHSHDTFEGSSLLAACEYLGEGTLCIIASGNDKPGVAAGLAKRYLPFLYIEKGDLASDVGVLITAVRKAQAAADLRINQSDSRLYAALYGKESSTSTIAETALVTFLGPAGGPVAFRKAISLSLAQLLPIYATRTAEPHWNIDRTQGSAVKSFWSKGLGRAIDLRLSRSDILQSDSEVARARSLGVNFVATATDATRDDFGGGIAPRIRDIGAR